MELVDQLDADRRSQPEYRCTNVLRDEPYEECDAITPMYLTQFERLRLGTIGGTSNAGQTMWVTILYSLLNRGVPDSVLFERVNGRGNADFARSAEAVLIHRQSTAATETSSLPLALKFLCTDNDILKRSTVSLNVFDNPGEIVARCENHHNSPFLTKMDGGFLFLDAGCDKEYQRENINRFFTWFRRENGLFGAAKAAFPLAVCLPKVDLLPNYYPEQRSEISRFIGELDESRQGDSCSQARIQRNSDLCRELLMVLWPDAAPAILKTIKNSVTQFQFFPMTPFLHGHGEQDMTKVEFEPFGIVEPLIWMLRMHGLRV